MIHVYKRHAGVVGTDDTFFVKGDKLCERLEWEYAEEQAETYGYYHDGEGNWQNEEGEESSEPECHLVQSFETLEDAEEEHGDCYVVE